jgi:hypothetical protein
MNIKETAEALPDIQVEQKESIKLIKNTKGFQWEVKILEINVDRLVQINKELELKFNNEKGGVA